VQSGLEENEMSTYGPLESTIEQRRNLSCTDLEIRFAFAMLVTAHMAIKFLLIRERSPWWFFLVAFAVEQSTTLHFSPAVFFEW
jgi:hypothetical protein